MSKFISTSKARFQNQDASIKNLETQVGQLAKLMSEKAQGTLPSNTEPNPRGQVNAVFLGSIGANHSEPLEMETIKLREQEPLIEKAIREHEPKILDLKSKVENEDHDNIEQLIDTFKQIQVNVPLIDAFF